MAVVDINAYTQVINSTTPSWASGPYKRANETTRKQYTRTYVIAGKGIERLVRGGVNIQDQIFLTLKPQFRRHGPNPTFDGYEEPQTGVMWTVPWSMGTTPIAWNEHSLAANQEANDDDDRAVKIKDYIWGQYQNAYTDLCNQEEDEYWATPNYLTMEALVATGTRVPYSLPVFNNEFDNGLPYGFGTAGGGTGKVMQLSRVDEVNWRPQRLGYTYVYATDGGSTIFPAFKQMMQLGSFDPLPMNEEYGPQSVSPDFITTSHWGGRLVDAAMRKNQDAFRGFGPTVGRDAAYSKLQFMGVPIVELEKLNTAALYPGSGAEDGSDTFVPETGTVSYTDSASVVHKNGPRFQAWHNEDLHSVWRKGFHREMSPAFTPSNQPYAIVRIVKLQNNNYVSRSRPLVTMFPKTADIADFAA
jgi:hypothetical protein